MDLAFHMLFARYNGPLTLTAPTASRLWKTFTFFTPFSYAKGGDPDIKRHYSLQCLIWPEVIKLFPCSTQLSMKF